MAATAKPIRKEIKNLVKEGHKRALKHADIVPYHKKNEKAKDKKQIHRLKEAHKSNMPIHNEKGKHVKKLMKKSA